MPARAASSTATTCRPHCSMAQPERAGSVARVPAAEVEAVVVKSVREHLKSQQAIDDRSLIETHVARVEVHPDRSDHPTCSRQNASRQRSPTAIPASRSLAENGIDAAREILLPEGTSPQQSSPDTLRKSRHPGCIDRPRPPLAQRTHHRPNSKRGNHCQARAVQRPQSEHDNLACLPRPRSRQSRDRRPAPTRHGRCSPRRPAGRMVSPAANAWPRSPH